MKGDFTHVSYLRGGGCFKAQPTHRFVIFLFTYLIFLGLPHQHEGEVPTLAKLRNTPAA